jgi:hypothetical protein
MLMLALLAMLIAGCGGFSRGKTEIQSYNFRSGTEGVSMKFMDGMPPKQLFVGTEFSIGVMLKNNGAYDIEGNAELTIIAPDKTAFQFKEGESEFFTLRGKSLYLKEGEENVISFPMKALCFPGYDGTRKSVVTNYTRKLKAKACYQYETTANADLCIDTHKFTRQKSDKPACVMKDAKLSGGQGGPVGVVSISPQVIPKGTDKTTVQIGISIKKLKGLDHQVFHPDNGCDIDHQNKILVGVEMGGKPLTCSPVEIKIKEKDAVSTICKTEVDSRLGAYSTPISVSMRYYVQQNIIKDITVEPPPGGVDCKAIKAGTS